MTVGSFLTKVIGGYTMYLTAKDANRFGMAFKNKNPQSKVAESYPDMYINTQRIELSNTVLPTIVCDAKKGYFDYFLRDTWFPFIYGVTGYTKGVFTGICHNIVPIALGIGALAFSKGGKERIFRISKRVNKNNPKKVNKKIIKIMCEEVIHPVTKKIILKKLPIRKSLPGKICAGLLLIGAMKSLMTNVCGFGDYKKL